MKSYGVGIENRKGEGLGGGHLIKRDLLHQESLTNKSLQSVIDLYTQKMHHFYASQV